MWLLRKSDGTSEVTDERTEKGAGVFGELVAENVLKLMRNINLLI